MTEQHITMVNPTMQTLMNVPEICMIVSLHYLRSVSILRETILVPARMVIIAIWDSVKVMPVMTSS